MGATGSHVRRTQPGAARAGERGQTAAGHDTVRLEDGRRRPTRTRTDEFGPGRWRRGRTQARNTRRGRSNGAWLWPAGAAWEARPGNEEEELKMRRRPEPNRVTMGAGAARTRAGGAEVSAAADGRGACGGAWRGRCGHATELEESKVRAAKCGRGDAREAETTWRSAEQGRPAARTRAGVDGGRMRARRRPSAGGG